MTPQELEKLKSGLLAEKQQIELELKEFTVENPAVKGDYKTKFPEVNESDTSDEKAQNVTEYERNRATEQMFESRLKEINDTLSRINDGEYGVCEKCSYPIDVKRLKAMPVARVCMDCSKKARLI
jgi:DnaK suppressor protein